MLDVSVVIPVYNGENFIKQSIETVLKQTYPNIEIIIVDDCSIDNTKKIIFDNFNSLIGSRIVYFRNKVNRERVFCRNIGVKLSRGNFIFFLDYDDQWKPEYIEKSLKYLRSNYDLVYSFPRSFINTNGDLIRYSKKPLKSLEQIIFSGQIGYPSATGFKRLSFFKFDENFLFREDWEIFLRAYLLGLKIKILDNDTVLMREHSNRTSKTIKFLEASLKVYESYKNNIPEQYLPYFLFHIGETALRYGDLTKGWQLILKAFIKSPRLLKDKRVTLSLLKRGFRIDRFFKYRRY